MELPKEPREEFVRDNDELQQYIDFIVPKIKEYNLQSGCPSTTKYIEHKDAKDLAPILDLSINEKGAKIADLNEIMGKTMQYSVRTNHPRFLDKFYVGTDPIGQIAEFLATVLNTNVHTYACSPVFSIMEKYCLNKLIELTGYNQENSDGIFVPGGSFGNITALIVARNTRFPHVKTQGWKGEDKPVIFTSEYCHYSQNRGAMMTGIGTDNCIKVKGLPNGQMDPEDLEKQIQNSIEQGRTPFFVGSTMGTTVFGAFDDMEKISAIAKKYNLWHHVDGCWGGIALFSEKYAHFKKGLELTDSFVFNPHKGLGAPLQCSMFLVNNKLGILEQSNSSGAAYLFHGDGNSAYDLGDKTLSCGRKADSFKMYLYWKRQGMEGFRRRVERGHDNIEHIGSKIRSMNDKFVLVCDEYHWNICFWYIPSGLRGYKNIEDIYEKLNEVTAHIYARMKQTGSILIEFTPLKKLPKFFRLVMNSPNVYPADMDFALEQIERFGEELNIQM